MKATGLVGLALLGLAACSRPAPAAPPSTSTSAEVEQLRASLDRLEERLLAAQSRVGLWGELRQRHEDVSAVTCKNLSEHARAVALFDGRQHDKLASLKRTRVASRFDPRSPTRR